jgi:hypothetical protein
MKRKLNHDEKLQDVVSAPYAKYGVTSRQLKSPKTGHRSCIVLSRGWPSWFWAAKCRGFDVKLILLDDARWKSVIRQNSPSTEVWTWNEIEDVTWGSVNTVFSDYDLGGKLKPLWDYVSNHVVLTKAARSPPPSWSHFKQQMHHFQYGGVTDGCWWVHVYLARAFGVSRGILVKEQDKRDLSTVLDSMVSSGRPCAAPKSVIITNPPKVIEVRPGTFHSCGLIPWNARKLWVIAPSVFSPTKWCCRGLTLTEKLLSRDVSQEQMALLSKPLTTELGQDNTYVPAKCCLALLDAMLEIDTHRRYDSSPLLSDGAATAAQWVGLPRHEVMISAGTEDQDSELELENRMLAEAELKRMKAATKSEDAEVPTHLWDQRLLPSLGQAQRTVVLTPLRAFALWWWRRHLLREFMSWFWVEHKHLNRARCDVIQILRNKAARADWEAGRECITCSSNQLVG